MKRVAINSQSNAESNLQFIKVLIDELRQRKVDFSLHENVAQQIHEDNIKTFNSAEEIKGVDFLFSVGGDGTLLDSITYVGDSGIPVLGINTGRFGYLATSTTNMLKSTLDALKNDEYEIDERVLLKMDCDDNPFFKLNYALNEVAILKRDSSSMIVIHAYIDGEFLNSYWADGLLVSTPTGSTGYSLSCGGPVVLPHSSNFIISPVCPHNLNMRPLVVSDDAELTFEIEGRNENIMLSLDSRSEIVKTSIKIAIKKQYFKIKVVKTKEYSYLSTLRNKLNWGTDVRN